MLWTDSEFLTAASLRLMDSDLPKVEAAEGLVLSGETGLIREALALIGSALQRRASGFVSGFAVSLAHTLAVKGSVSSRFHLPQIVITSPYPGITAPIVLWATYRALDVIYTQAVNRKVDSDRYADKALLYRQSAADAWSDLAVHGLPIVGSPLSAPGAVFMPNTGSFGSSDVTVTASAGTDWVGGDYLFAVTYVGAGYVSSTQKGNSESAPSAVLTKAVSGGASVAVGVANLIQEAPDVAFGVGVPPWMTPVGWNLYVGTSASDMRLQNSSPIPLSSDYSMLSAPSTDGALLGSGQAPDRLFQLNSNDLILG